MAWRYSGREEVGRGRTLAFTSDTTYCGANCRNDLGEPINPKQP